MKNFLVFFCLSIGLFQIGVHTISAFDYGDVRPPDLDSVHIGKTAIVMPLGKILLIRKDGQYCAVKFTKFWTGKTPEDFNAQYESYCPAGEGGDFSQKNVRVVKERLSFPKPRGIGRLAFSIGNKEIKCGAIRLLWSGIGAVHFYAEGQKQGDYGIELAPTKWDNISEANVLDKRLRWYRFDPKRPRQNIPIKNIW